MTQTLRTILEWDHKLGIRRTVVLFVTLWMTWRSFAWACDYAYAMKGIGGLEIAAIIGAVTAPIAYLQKVVFDSYIGAKNASSPA